MKPSIEQVQSFIKDLQNGYKANGRQTMPNERLALIVVLVTVTKQSIPQVLQFKYNQFIAANGRCIIRWRTVRAGNPRRAELPLSFYEYIAAYSRRNFIAKGDKLFELNPDYVGNRIRELQRIGGYPFSIGGIQKIISADFGTKQYSMMSQELTKLLVADEKEENLVCMPTAYLIHQIAQFTKELQGI